MKDKRIRTRQAEIETMVENKTAIVAAAGSPGPFIYSVQADRLLRLQYRSATPMSMPPQFSLRRSSAGRTR